jgi:hypothetical protein
MKWTGLFVALLCCHSLWATVFTVRSTYSQGPGSFRSAVDSANNALGHDSIYFSLTGPGPFTVFADTLATLNIVISDSLLIDGFSQPGASFPGSLITFQQFNSSKFIQILSSEVEIRGLKWKNYTTRAFKIQMGTLAGIRDISFHHNVLDHSTGLQMQVFYGEFSGIYMDDNFLECGSRLLICIIDAQPTRCSVDSIFIRNNEGLCTTAGYMTLGSFESRNHGTIDGIWMEDNSLTSTVSGQVQGLALVLGESGVSERDTARNLYFLRNHLKGSSAYQGAGLVAEVGQGFKGSISHIVADSNVLDSVGSGFFLRNWGGDLNGTQLRDVAITHNHVSDGFASALGIEGRVLQGASLIDGLLIADNEFHNFGFDGIHVVCEFAPFQGDYRNWEFLRNHVSGNSKAGIYFTDGDATASGWSSSFQNITFSENSIHENGWEGIVLNGTWGATAGMPCKLPVPQLSHVSPQAPYTVFGTLAGSPNTPYRIEFFTNTQPDSSGFGEGETFIGADSLTLNGSGTGQFVWPTGLVSQPIHVTATATNLINGNTGCLSNVVDTMTVGNIGVANTGIDVYPNPSKGEFLHFRSGGEGPLAITFTNTVGQNFLIDAWTYANGQGEINLGNLPSGYYCLRMQFTDNSFSQRVCILR